jgi:hypothetical protein
MDDESVKNVERYLEKNCDKKLPKRVSRNLPTNYRPELDITEELVGDELSYFHSQIRILRWIVELGRTDVIAVKMLYFMIYLSLDAADLGILVTYALL